MVRILVTGEYNNYLLTYHCIAEYENGARERICGTFTGSEIEAEVQAVGMAIRYAIQKRLTAVIYTPFKQVLSYIKSGWTPQTKTIKEFMSLVKKIDTSKISFSNDVPENFIATYNSFVKMFGNKVTTDNKSYFLGDRSGKWIKTFPLFRVLLYSRENELKLDINNYDYGEDFLAAIDFCDWYDKEVLDSRSTYYGWRVVRYNVPLKEKEPAKQGQAIPNDTSNNIDNIEQITFGSGKEAI